LFGEAKFWWMEAQQMMEAKVELLDWKSFRLRSPEKYFPNSVKFAKEIEFQKLEQGNM